MTAAAQGNDLVGAFDDAALSGKPLVEIPVRA